MDKRKQRYWDSIFEGEEIPTVKFPLSVYRLVMAAGTNLDFNSIHHNTEYAQKTGAQEMYANKTFLLGMWEKSIREYIGVAGEIKRIARFRIKSFNIAGDTVIVKGLVKRKWQQGEDFFVELEMWSENSNGISIGPGEVIVTLPNNDI